MCLNFKSNRHGIPFFYASILNLELFLISLRGNQTIDLALNVLNLGLRISPNFGPTTGLVESARRGNFGGAELNLAMNDFLLPHSFVKYF